MSADSYDPAAHYDRVTEAWGLLLGDELHYGVFLTGDEPLEVATGALTAMMIEGAELAPGLAVLDVGCGSGAPACRLATEHAVTVLGITTSEVGVAAATARAEAAGIAGVEFEQRDGTDNGLPDESFDRVWVLESSHLMPDRAALLAECARVLRPGGRMVLCDIIRRREVPFLELRDRRDEFAVLRSAYGAARMDPLEEYADLAGRAGLEIDRAVDITAETLPTFGRWQANLDRHRDRVTELLGREATSTFERSLGILDAFWRDGTLGYGLMAARKPDQTGRVTFPLGASLGAHIHSHDQEPPAMQSRRTVAQESIRTFLSRAGKDVDAEVATSLFADGLGLDSLETAELSAILEDDLGSDPFSEGQLPQTIAEILDFYDDHATVSP